jgi:drug/metabolite transporter (DMT)-like permease
MTTAGAYAAVAASSVTHAYWNFLFKRAGGGQAFVTLSKCVEALMLTPIFVGIGIGASPDLLTHWPLPVFGAVLVLLNYVMLARAYESGNLALIYPISRGAILAFLPPAGLMVLGERISPLGGVGLGIIMLGIALMPLSELSWSAVVDAFGRRNGGVGFALCAALFGALYTVWSKRAVGVLPVFEYFYAYTALTALAMLMFAPRLKRSFREVWREHWWAITRVAALNSGAYLLVLAALGDGVSSYLIAIRQLSIVWRVLLGRYLLREAVSMPQKFGVAMLIAGCALITLA